MTSPSPALPCDLETLRADIRRLWPEAARAHGVDPATAHGSVYPHSEPPLVLYVSCAVQPLEPLRLAVEDLARSLEDIGYAIERVERPGTGLGPCRVLGWEAHHFGRGRHREAAPARLIDRASWHPVVVAWRKRLADERTARDAESP